MTGHEGQMSFERQVAAFLGSMSDEVPAGPYAPPRSMLRRANARMSGTVAVAALGIALLCLGGVLLSRALHDAIHHPARMHGSPQVMIGAQAAAYAADSISTAAVGWVDGGAHGGSGALGLGGLGGSHGGGYGWNGGAAGPLGGDWTKEPIGAPNPPFGYPGGDRGSGGGSGGGGSGGGGSGGGGSGGDPGGSGGGGDPGDGHGGGKGGGIGPDIPGGTGTVWGWGTGAPPLQGTDVWLGNGAVRSTGGGSEASGGAPEDVNQGSAATTGATQAATPDTAAGGPSPSAAPVASR
jgi:hypothetical protein